MPENQNTDTKPPNQANNSPVQNIRKPKSLLRDKHIQNSLSFLYFIVNVGVPLFLNTKNWYIYSFGGAIIYIVGRLTFLKLKKQFSKGKKTRIIAISIATILLTVYITHKVVEITEPIAFETKAPPCSHPKTLSEYFSCIGYPYSSSLESGLPIYQVLGRDTIVLDIKMKLHIDFKSNSFYFFVYIPSNPKSDKYVLGFCKYIAQIADEEIITMKDSLVHYEEGNKENITLLENLTFTGRVIICHEPPILVSEKEQIIELFKKQNKYVLFFDSTLDFLKDEKSFVWRPKNYKNFN